MRTEVKYLEQDIVRRSSEYRKATQEWNIRWTDVRDALSKKSVAIEFIELPGREGMLYEAVFIRKGYKMPRSCFSFSEKELRDLYQINKKNTINNSYTCFVKDGDTIGNGIQLSQLIWGQILPFIKKGETIYFAPSGLLHQLAIEHLPYDETRTMADVYNMVRLSSTREIVINKSKSKLQYSNAVVYGGISYDIDKKNMQEESKNYPLLALRSIDDALLIRGRVDELPATKVEAESISELLKKNNIAATMFTSTKANEESFKSLSGKHHNIIHIGTHGFTWTDSVAKKQDFFTQRMQLMGQEQHYDASIDPLNRCGLLFAGANIALQGNSKDLPEGVQDGILTAKEISLLDLRDADLVVLSACETAKGDITSEGVFGLQRAFKMAGVQTIIMSLWKVHDEATQLLMTEFYTNWIGKKQSKREAFRNAQKVVREQYVEPYYWAGFIMLD
jgi:CHAT domain-containing protein